MNFLRRGIYERGKVMREREHVALVAEAMADMQKAKLDDLTKQLHVILKKDLQVVTRKHQK